MVPHVVVRLTELVDSEAGSPGGEDQAYELASVAQGVRIPVV